MLSLGENIQALINAARDGNIDEVNRILLIPGMEESVPAEGNLALTEAARNGHVAVVNRLLAIPAVMAAAPAHILAMAGIAPAGPAEAEEPAEDEEGEFAAALAALRSQIAEAAEGQEEGQEEVEGSAREELEGLAAAEAERWAAALTLGAEIAESVEIPQIAEGLARAEAPQPPAAASEPIDPNMQALLDAVERGSLEDINNILIMPGIEDVLRNFQFINDFLVIAATRGDLNIVNRLLESPAIANTLLTDQNYTAFQMAANINFEILNRLLQVPGVRIPSYSFLLNIPGVIVPPGVAEVPAAPAPAAPEPATDQHMDALHAAVENGTFDDINNLLNMPGIEDVLRRYQHINDFLVIAVRRDLNIVNRLLESPGIANTLLTDQNHTALQTASANLMMESEDSLIAGYIAILNRLLEVPGVRASAPGYILAIPGVIASAGVVQEPAAPEPAAVQQMGALDAVLAQMAQSALDDIAAESSPSSPAAKAVSAPTTESEKAFIKAIAENNIEESRKLIENPLIHLHIDFLQFALETMKEGEEQEQALIWDLLLKAVVNANEHWNKWEKEASSAIAKKDLKELGVLLEENPLVERYIARNNNQLLFDAVANNNEAAVKRLLQFGRVKRAEVDLLSPARYRAIRQARRVNPVLVAIIEKSVAELSQQLAPEEAMADLTAGEDLAIRALRKRYGPILYQGRDSGVPRADEPDPEFVDPTIATFKKYFRARYEKNPIKVMDKGEEKPLPFDYDAGNPLCVEHVNLYYNHRLLSAARYFAKPNPLLDPTFPYVARFPDGSGYANNSIVQKEHMALMWLAVNNPPKHPDWVEGSRKQKYIDDRYESDEDVLEEFVMIYDDLNRGHNNDEGRDPTKGPDRPTCDRGVTKRIAQSLQSILGIPPLTENYLVGQFNSEIVRSNEGGGLVDKINHISDEAVLKHLYQILYNDIVIGLDKWDDLSEDKQNFLKQYLSIDKKALAQFIEKYRRIYLDPDSHPDPQKQTSLFNLPGQIHCSVFSDKPRRSGEELVHHMASDAVLFNQFCQPLYEAVSARRKALEIEKTKQSREQVQAGVVQGEGVAATPAPVEREQRKRKEREVKEKTAEDEMTRAPPKRRG